MSKNKEQTPEFKELIENLNPEQKEAVTSNNGPLLIVAGAGTGKTHLVTAKMAYLIMEKEIKTDNILALTFTDKASQEMEDRVIKLLPYGYLDLWIHTFHSFGERLLREHAIKIGLSPDFNVLNSSQQWLLIYENLERFALSEFYDLSNPSKYIKDLITHFNQAKDELISPQEYLDWAEELYLNKDSLEFIKKNINIDEDIDDLEPADLLPEIKKYKELAEAYHVYQQLLKENNAIDFADMIYYSYKLLKDNSYLLKKYQNKFKHIIVDEFQDTNYSQYKLIQLLSAKHKNLTVVGDDDQSIYRFRGASIFNILKFKDDYPNAKEVVLTKNYRSGQNILDAAYKSIQNNNPNRLEKKLHINKALQSQTENPGEVEHYYLETEDGEITTIINKIKQLSTQKDFSWSDIAILTRTNNAIEPFMKALEIENIPYQFVSSRGLYNKNIILNIISYFKLLDNYHESTALYRILTLNFLNIDIKDIMVLNQYSKSHRVSLWETCQKAASLDISEDNLNKITRLLFLINKHSKLATQESVLKVYIEVLKDLGYLEYLLNNTTEQKEEDLWYLQLFSEKLKEFEYNYKDNRLTSFMEILKLEIQAGDTGSLRMNPKKGPEFINLMTVHGSKGLEFRWVFLPILTKKKFPTGYRSEKLPLPEVLIKESNEDKKVDLREVHLQEERRLFYVALTRAKEAVYLSYARKYNTRKSDAMMSPFLQELNIKEEQPLKQEIDNALFDLERFTSEISLKPDLYQNVDKKFSFTKLRNYDDCPYKFYLQYIIKIPTYIETHHLTFGNSIHHVFHKFLSAYKNNNSEQLGLFGKDGKKIKLNFEYLKKLYEEAWKPTGYESQEQKEKYKKLGYQIMKSFWQDFEKEPPKVKDLEKQANIKLEGCDFILESRLDRVDELKEGGLEIIDYKTGKVKKKLKAPEKRQLLLYYLAAKEIYGQYPKKLTYLYTNEWYKTNFIPKEKDIEKLVSWITNIVNNIKNQNFDPKPNEYKCRYCSFKSICQFRK